MTVLALVAASSSGALEWIFRAAEDARPWLSTSALVALLGLCVKLYLDNKKMELDTEGGIRDHYAKEVASLRRQLVDVTTLSDQRIANAQKLYDEAMDAAKARHDRCEAQCDRLREKVVGLERLIEQISRTSMKMFEPRSDLPEEQKERMRSMEQEAKPKRRMFG